MAKYVDGFVLVIPNDKTEEYRKMAESLSLLVTGGSDSHNRKGRYGDIGEEKVPLEYLTAMKARREKLFPGLDNQGA